MLGDERDGTRQPGPRSGEVAPGRGRGERNHPFGLARGQRRKHLRERGAVAAQIRRLADEREVGRDPDQLLELRADAPQRLPIIVRRAVATQRELDLGGRRGERRAQVVRDRGGERLGIEAVQRCSRPSV
jgi:hypothetical protein